jgi:23S rRNA (uracil1939-C5)-methyltransferase
VRRKNKEILLEKIIVEDYAAEGKSLARVNGKVIFMENAIPGDIVDVKLIRNKKDWAEGLITHFHQFSEDRVPAFCSHFGVCGGCQWQMLPYPKQILYKQKQVEDNLSRIGKVELPRVQPLIGSTQTTGYRNKMEYSFSNKRFLLTTELGDPLISSTRDSAGFHAKGIFDKVIDIETCYLQEEPSNLLRHAVKNWAIANHSSFYDIKLHTGWLRTLQLRICTTGELMVNIIFGHQDEKIKLLLDHILTQFPQITTLLYTINPKWNDSLSELSPQVYFGKGYVVEMLDHFKFKIGPKSFFQTNSRQALCLYQVIRDFCGLTGGEIVYDLYCGTGSIGIFVSELAKKIVGIEIIPEAIDDARENATINKIGHASFFAGDVTDLCNADFYADQGRPEVIITDPPRAGMDEKLIRKILDIGAKTVVYASCNPATQARDLNRLDEKYKVMQIQPVDLFPHTHHIENVVRLELRSG